MATEVNETAPSPPPRAARPRLRTLEAIIARSVALFLGIFALANIAVGFQIGGSDPNLWWIDLRPLPGFVGNFFLICTGFFLVIQALLPRENSKDVRILRASIVILGLVALLNCGQFYALVARGTIESRFPLPFSLLTFTTCAYLFFALRRTASTPLRAVHYVGVVACVGILAVAYPLAQMFSFGLTDYRRSADAAVVFGAGLTPSGAPSLALADRVRTAVDLYREGLVPRLIFSGGPAAGDRHETHAMRDLAIAEGIPANAIVLDQVGVSTWATVLDTRTYVADCGLGRVLAVSHFYHLPRIKLTYQRAGLDVFTVPAKETRPLVRLPFYIAREIAAFWYYYARPLGTPG